MANKAMEEVIFESTESIIVKEEIKKKREESWWVRNEYRVGERVGKKKK